MDKKLDKTFSPDTAGAPVQVLWRNIIFHITIDISRVSGMAV
jgi:hypothetical protein